jgi:hypothetical protein
MKSTQQPSLKKQDSLISTSQPILRKPQLPFKKIGDNLNVFLSEKAFNKMKFLCENINKIEWSGCIVYSIEGSLTHKESIFIEVHDLIPLDKGSVSFTSYSFDERVLNFMVENNYLEYKIGHLHSHHTMNTFFSGTDLEEVNENSEFIKPYLSIIINNKYEFSCKLAFRLKVLGSSVYEYQDIDNNMKETYTNDKDEYVGYYDCNVIVPKLSIDDKEFMKQYENIIKPKPVAIVNKNHQSYQGYQSKLDLDDWVNYNTSYGWEGFDDKSILVDDYPNEDFIAYVLRLGIGLKNKETLDDVLEDIDNLYIRDKSFLVESYAKTMVDDFRIYVKDFFKLNMVEDEFLKQQIEMFTDTLYFNKDAFYFIDELLEELNNLKLI